MSDRPYYWPEPGSENTVHRQWLSKRHGLVFVHLLLIACGGQVSLLTTLTDFLRIWQLSNFQQISLH